MSVQTAFCIKLKDGPTRDSIAGRGSLLIWRHDDKPRLAYNTASTPLPQTITSLPLQRHNIAEESRTTAFRIRLELNNYVTARPIAAVQYGEESRGLEREHQEW
jgi:hypothetical protein